MKYLSLALALLLIGCSTPEERIAKLQLKLRSGKISMDEYNRKFRKFDQLRLRETRDSFMR